MGDLHATLREPTGFSYPLHFESSVIILGFVYGRHQDAGGYGRSGECTLAVYVKRDGKVASSPIWWFEITDAASLKALQAKEVEGD